MLRQRRRNKWDRMGSLGSDREQAESSSYRIYISLLYNYNLNIEVRGIYSISHYHAEDPHSSLHPTSALGTVPPAESVL